MLGAKLRVSVHSCLSTLKEFIVFILCASMLQIRRDPSGLYLNLAPHGSLRTALENVV